MIVADEPNSRALERLIEYIQESRGMDFRGYKQSSLCRRVTARMQQVGSTGFEEYHSRLEADPGEFRDLLNTVLINVTAFFRDTEAWEKLRSDVIPFLLGRERERRQIRVWSAGCASGEEPYSIAMLLAEALGLREFGARVKIYATDLDEDALALARQATYAPRDVADVAPDLLEKYFEHTGDSYTVHRELRRRVIFGRHNIVVDAPISRIDLLACRNLLIYFERGTQDKILPRLHYALVDDGVLFLGKAETQLARSKLFQPIDMRHRLFRKTPQLWRRLPGGSVAADEEPRQQRGSELFEAVLDASAIGCLVISNEDVLVLANPAARRMLELAPADIGRPFHELIISYRPLELRSRIEDVRARGRPLHISGVQYQRPDTEAIRFDVDVVPLPGPRNNYNAILVAFTDATRMHHMEQELEAAQATLETTIEELQSANEELETTNEELQSNNEELETTNEELQSTNEELETINEELRSTNEELEIANQELRRQSDRANLYHAQSEAMLASIDAGIIVVNSNLRVLSWNSWNEKVWGVREEEAIGQNLPDLDFGLPLREITEDLQLAAIGQAGKELVLAATNRFGRPVKCRVRISALRNEGAVSDENPPRGVVLITNILPEPNGRY
jgi:two-component system CheB/CheR fusion protein